MTSMCDANEVNGTVGQSYKDFYKRSLHGDSQETWGQFYKTFLSVIYEFSY
jgi:hypothetical protein